MVEGSDPEQTVDDLVAESERLRCEVTALREQASGIALKILQLDERRKQIDLRIRNRTEELKALQ